MPWSKVLWKHQDLPDNYVPDSFLSSLRRNTKIKQYEYSRIVEDMMVLPLNLALVQIFVAGFLGIHNGKLDPIAACAGAFLHTAVLGWFWSTRDGKHKKAQSIKAVVLLSILARALSPVFLSLTRATSSDSIWHLTAWLCIVYIVLAGLPMKPPRHTRIMATNTALSATVVLASRLATSEQVFYFMLFNFQTFVLLPSAGLWIHRTSPKAYMLFVCEACIVGNILTWVYVEEWLAFGCLVAQMVTAFEIPRWFILIQKYKDQISGPWDPAKAVIDVAS